MGRRAATPNGRRTGQPAQLRGILISRVSSKKQANEDRYSLAAQSRAMHECCERKSIVIVDELVEPGRSAFTHDITRLPALHEALLRVEAGEANAIVMHETSRLARNEQLGNHVLDRLSACGGSFINSTYDIDYTTPEGRAFYNSEVSMHAYSSRKTSEHARKGKDEQYLRGLQVGAIPFGYAAQRNAVGQPDRSLPAVIVPDEADAIRKAFQDRALRRTATEIAREWNTLGLKPRSVRGISRFSPMTVRSILENRYYYGMVTHGGETRLGLHQPVVTEDEWMAAQHPTRRVTRRRHPPMLLQGIATCAACNAGVYPFRPRKSAKRPNERYSYYRESASRECPDEGVTWPSDEPDGIAAAVLRSLLLDRDWLAYVEWEAHNLPDDISARRKGVEETLRRIQREYFRGSLDEADYLKLRREHQAELALLPATKPGLLAAARTFETFAELWDSASAEARNATAKTIFDAAYLDMRERTISFAAAPEFEPILNLRASSYVSCTQPGRD